MREPRPDISRTEDSIVFAILGIGIFIISVIVLVVVLSTYAGRTP